MSMYRSHPNLVPVTNKYLEHQRFLKVQQTHRSNLRNIHGLLDLAAPSPRAHCSERLRQKQMRDYESKLIEHENDRLQQRMEHNGAFVDARNDYVVHSLNLEKRHRDETRHQHELDRLQKQIKHARTNYSTRDYDQDYHKQQDFKRRISRFPSETKK